MQDHIIIKGAREHNLKNISAEIPRDKVVVITGPSGSGKSSLAIDTIYAEGQRRYVESLSSYARQFIGEMQKPEVDLIEGLSPSIAIDQKTISQSPRSTVGTITDIYNYLRVLYTHAGDAHCYNCGSGITTQDTEGVMQNIMSLPDGTRIQLLVTVVRERKGEHRQILLSLRKEGFIRARVDGEMLDLSDNIKLKKSKRHTIEVVVDRLIVKKNFDRKLRNALDTGLRHGDTITINLIDEERDIIFSKSLSCPDCGTAYPEMTHRLFSFNSKVGACPKCNGLGFINSSDEKSKRTCGSCKGLRLRDEALAVTIDGKNIMDLSVMPVTELSSFIESMGLSERQRFIVRRVTKEINERLKFLADVGLDYLSLSRLTSTLSGGEAQRVRLAHQLGSSLTGVLYVLDEPSIGLHPSDCSKLINTLNSIRDAGNSVLIVEHDEDTIRAADHVVDMGPGGGTLGGSIVAADTPQGLSNHPGSVTGKFLSGKLSIPLPKKRRKTRKFIDIKGASAYNLKNIDVRIPLGIFNCVTGVSGSGKSTLIFEVLYRALTEDAGQTPKDGKYYTEVRGIEKIDNVIYVDQSPLGKSARSNPATYTGIFTYIRDLFALLPDSKVRGYTSSRFSFNVKGGRCEDCQGAGITKHEMHFLPDVFVACKTCKGTRFNNETLQILYKGHSISDVLEMTIADALEFFSAIPSLKKRLYLLNEIGLGYIKLGQPSVTLSGGEAQRIKLSRELSKKASERTLYILDEPTTGLHFVDIEKLLRVMNRLVDMGNTVLVIEHNPDIIKSVDHIIDLGPGGGENGGRVVASGTPEEVSRIKGSVTGKFLKQKYFNGAKHAKVS